SANVVGANKVTVSGLSIGSITGTNSSAASDYVLDATSKDVSAVITAKSVTLSGMKTYDGTTGLSGSVTIGGLLSGQTLGYSGATSNSPNVSDNGTNYISAITLSDGTGLASNYALPSLTGYSAGVNSVTINAAALTVTGSLTGSSKKVYDGTTVATLTSENYLLNGFVGSEGATVTKTTGTYDNKNVGTNKTITVSLLSGDYLATGSTNLGNYTLPTTVTGDIGEITRANLTISGLLASNKVYDATTAATLTGTAKVTPLGNDVVSVGGSATGTFADKNVGTSKAVTVSGNTISGTDAGNYTLLQQSGLSADITKANLTVSGLLASNKVYDATTAATLTGTAKVTPLGSDVVSLGGSATGTFADKNVGTSKAVTVSGNTISGTDAGNYTLLQQSGLSADITKANLTVTAGDVSKKYGTVPSLTLFSISGLIGSETVGSVTLTSAGSAATASVAGSPYPITPGNAEGGTFSLSNYTVSYVDGKLRVEDIPQTVIPTITVTINVPSVVPAGITTQFPTGSMSIGRALSNSTTTSLSLPSVTTVASAGTSGSVVPENKATAPTNTGTQNSSGNTLTVADTGSTTAVTSGSTNQASDINQASLPLGGTASAGETPAPFTGVINVSVGGKLVRQSQNAVIPLPDNVTAGLSKGTGNEKVTLDNGAPLPSWLQYDSGSRSFKIISQPEKSFNIKVRVQDKNRSWEVNLSSS
ncbi:hypothetical protein G9409_10285, partial [Chlorobium sp. BLA1]|uniref:beta strand repeat-containing protein n=1 Tax=Candidatus Chlorobium masyuteum TaxID=2716876 RepID=UPI001AA07CC1